MAEGLSAGGAAVPEEAAGPAADAGPVAAAKSVKGPGLARAGRKRTQKGYDRRDYATKVTLMGRVCRRIEAGTTLAEACRDPDMPVATTVRSWADKYPEFRARLDEAESAARAMGAGRARYHTWSDETAAELLGRIEDGRGLAEVCADPEMPAHCSVTRWLAERPAFREAYRQARETQADRLFDLAWRIACEAGEDDWRSAKLRIETLKWRVGRLVPRKYGPWKAVAAPAAGVDADLAALAAAEAEAAEGAQPRRMLFEIRDWARGPEGGCDEVVEVTDVVRGLTPVEVWRVHEAVRAGRYERTEDGVATRVAWRDFDCGDPPEDVLRRQRLTVGGGG